MSDILVSEIDEDEEVCIIEKGNCCGIYVDKQKAQKLIRELGDKFKLWVEDKS